MAITPLQGPLDPRRLREAAGTAQTEKVAGTEKSTREVGDRLAASTDRTSFAQDAIELQHEVTVAKAALENVPDVRADRMAAVQERLANGFYDRPEVLDEVANRMAGDPAIYPTDDDLDETKPQQAASRGAIEKRLATGYYDQTKVKNEIAERLAQDVSNRVDTKS